MLRDDLMWVVLDGTTAAVPLVGSYEHMWKTLEKHHGATCTYGTFKNFMNGSTSKLLHEKGKGKPDIFWELTSEPSAAVALLGNGDSLVGLNFEPTQLRIDDATVAPTAPVAPTTAAVAPTAVAIATVAPTAAPLPRACCPTTVMLLPPAPMQIRPPAIGDLNSALFIIDAFQSEFRARRGADKALQDASIHNADALASYFCALAPKGAAPSKDAPHLVLMPSGVMLLAPAQVTAAAAWALWSTELKKRMLRECSLERPYQRPPGAGIAPAADGMGPTQPHPCHHADGGPRLTPPSGAPPRAPCLVTAATVR